MKKFKLKIIIIMTIIFFVGASFFPNISSSSLTYQHNNSITIGLEHAKRIAETKISMSKSSDYIISEAITIKNIDDSTLMYVFNLNPKGYIIVPVNKKLPPIIAYSFANNFGDISEENILLQLLKADVSNRIENINLISEEIIKHRYKQWQKYTHINLINQQNLITTVGPLLDTQWSQSPPFNNFCPLDSGTGQRSVAGCPAVAMAQIINYHKTTQNVQFTDDDDYRHNYAGNNYIIDDDYEEYDFPSFPELNTYLNTLMYNYENDIQLTNDDKAAINFACGVAARQVYTSGGSGTFGVDQAFDAYQRFYFEDIKLLTEGSDVYDQLQSNILNGLPAHIAVVNEAWTVGHNMVVDGYDTEGHFHINFGYNGSYDGWYMLPTGLPLELTVLEGLIVDIEPNVQEGGLSGNGLLNWDDVIAGSTLTGSFTIQNSGNSGSSIDWVVEIWPEWGTWAFTPESGDDLKPEDGEITIDVEVISPDKKNKEFAGYIKIVNTENSSDYCLIHISLTTPKCLRINHFPIQFLEKHPYLFYLLKNIIKPSLNL